MIKYLNFPYSFGKYFSHFKGNKPAKVMELGSQCITNLPHNFTSLWCWNLKQDETSHIVITLATFIGEAVNMPKALGSWG